MNFSVHQDILKPILQVANAAVASKSPIKAMTGIKFELVEGQKYVYVYSTNLEIGIRIKMPVYGNSGSGSFVVPAKLFTDLVMLMGGHVHVSYANDQVTVQSESFNNVISCYDADDFPTIPFMEVANDLEMKTDDFRQAMGIIAHAAARDNSRPILRGVNVKIVGGNLSLTCADGFRLARISIPSQSNGDFNVIVPAPAMVLAAKTSGEENVVVSVTDRHIQFSSGLITVMSVLIDGKYPDIERVIPSTEPQFTCEVNVKEFLKAVKISSLVSTSQSVVLDIGETVSVAVKQNEIGASVNTVGTKLFSGTPLITAMNFAYLNEALTSLQSESAILRQTNNMAPLMISSSDKPNALVMVMPVVTR